MEIQKRLAGFSIGEILLVLVILGILAVTIILNLAGTDQGARAAELGVNVQIIREAMLAYKVDHGWYPCDDRDWNNHGDPQLLKKQLTYYTNAAGEVGTEKSPQYRFGPYLEMFPLEPITESDAVRVDTGQRSSLDQLRKWIASAEGSGGWYYQPKSGNFLPNLGRDFAEYYVYY